MQSEVVEFIAGLIFFVGFIIYLMFTPKPLTQKQIRIRQKKIERTANKIKKENKQRYYKELLSEHNLLLELLHTNNNKFESVYKKIYRRIDQKLEHGKFILDLDSTTEICIPPENLENPNKRGHVKSESVYRDGEIYKVDIANRTCTCKENTLFQQLNTISKYDYRRFCRHAVKLSGILSQRKSLFDKTILEIPWRDNFYWTFDDEKYSYVVGYREFENLIYVRIVVFADKDVLINDRYEAAYHQKFDMNKKTVKNKDFLDAVLSKIIVDWQ